MPDPRHTPSKAEIARATAAIRAEWSEDELRRRSTTHKYRGVDGPVIREVRVGLGRNGFLQREWET